VAPPGFEPASYSSKNSRYIKRFLSADNITDIINKALDQSEHDTLLIEIDRHRSKLIVNTTVDLSTISACRLAVEFKSPCWKTDGIGRQLTQSAWQASCRLGKKNARLHCSKCMFPLHLHCKEQLLSHQNLYKTIVTINDKKTTVFLHMKLDFLCLLIDTNSLLILFIFNWNSLVQIPFWVLFPNRNTVPKVSIDPTWEQPAT